MNVNKKIRHYACQTCQPREREVLRYKGLCRSCTTYGDDGSVIEAVNRVPSDEFGNPLNRIATRRTPTNRAGEYQKVGFRQARKPTKKQQATIATEVEIPEMVETLAGGEEE